MHSPLLRWLLPLAAVLALGACRSEPGDVAVASWVEPDKTVIDIAVVVALDTSQWTTGRQADNQGYTNRPVWFRIGVTVPEGLVGDDCVLEFQNPVLDGLDVYLPEPVSGGWRVLRMGDKVPFAQRPLLSRNFAVPFDCGAGPSVTVYARVESTSSVQLPTRLLTRQELAGSDQLDLLRDAGFIGVVLGLAAYNLLLMFRIREPLYFYYVAWLLLMGTFVVSLDGTAFQYLWPEATQWNDRAIVLSLLTSTWCLVAFWLRALADFIGPRFFVPDHGWAGVIVIAAVVATLLPYPIAIQTTIVLTLACALGLAVLAWQAARRGFSDAKLLLLSYLPMMFGGYLLAMQRFGWIGHTLATQHAIALGCSMQAILLSAVLADRFVKLREKSAGAEEMRRFNRSLEESNAALEASNSALKEALQISEARALAIGDMKERLRAAAEERNREKSKFLAQAVHDLKQPLQAISLALAPIQSMVDASGARQIAGLIDLVQRASLVMRSQISGLLDLSRLESGIVRPAPTVFAVGPFLDQSLEPLEDYAKDKGVSIRCEFEAASREHVHSDLGLLRQMASNIVGNAIKYADPAKEPDCWVRIACGVDADHVTVMVEDNGIGIDERHLASGAIFLPFFQAQNLLPEGEKGVGLGLSIVNAALALMPDHRLHVESRLGFGSRFMLSVPRATVETTEANDTKQPEEANMTGLAGMYVLLVEDDILVRQSIAALLGFYGVLSSEFASVADLAANLSTIERQPDAVLSDYRLPDNQTAMDVRALIDPVWPGVPMVVVTGDAGAAARFEAGTDMFGVLRKPVAPAELIEKLAAACRRGEA